jgi:hypothetical protein
MKVCKICKESKDLSKFGSQSRNKSLKRNQCRSCLYKRERDSMSLVQKKSRKDKIRQWARDNKYHARYKSMVHSDKVRFKCNTISRDSYKGYIKQECHYCERQNCGGVDRMDSSIGHVDSNCVPCCEKCNFILGDLSYSVKINLKCGLKKSYEEGDLKEWKIPIKRRK